MLTGPDEVTSLSTYWIGGCAAYPSPGAESMDGRVGRWRELGVSDGLDRAVAGLSEQCTFLRKGKDLPRSAASAFAESSFRSSIMAWPADCQQGKFPKES